VVTAIQPGQDSWANSVIPHELMHLVTHERIANCTGSDLPTWFDEGLAMNAEGPIKPEDQTLLDSALKARSIEPLHALDAGFSADPQRAALDYVQSQAVVAFMIQQYGADKIAATLDGVKAEKPFDTALQEAYGLDTDRIDNAWRTSLHYGELVATPAPTQAGQSTFTPVPTIALDSPYGPTATSAPENTPAAARALASSPTPVQARAAATAVPPAAAPKTPFGVTWIALLALIAGGIAVIVVGLGLVILFAVLRKQAP